MDTELDALRATIGGTLIDRHDPEYDEARRVWNGMIDRRPAVIVRAASVDDIAPVIAFAREHGLLLAVRGGGHNVAGNGTVDDGLVLDLGGLKEVDVDADGTTVRVAPGATLGDLDHATEPYGLIVPVGVVSGTGVTGLTLGGGFGWLTRAFGLTIDSLLAAEVITADGALLEASEAANADLFWGLRGGGGNFGVVSSLTFRAQRLGPQVASGNLIYRAPNWRLALEAYADWTADLPDALTSIVTIIVPPLSWQLGDDPLLVIGFTWAEGDASAFERLVNELIAAAPPDEQAVEPARWVDWQSQADELFPRGSRAYWKNSAFEALDQATIDVVLDWAARLPAGTAADIHHMDGAVTRPADDATAFPGRGARYWLNIYGFWSDPSHDAERTAWVRGFHAAMAPHARPGQYVNFAGYEGRRADARQLALAAYGPDKLERLVELKRRYDPDNVFRLNHNIPPD